MQIHKSLSSLAGGHPGLCDQVRCNDLLLLIELCMDQTQVGEAALHVAHCRECHVVGHNLVLLPEFVLLCGENSIGLFQADGCLHGHYELASDRSAVLHAPQQLTKQRSVSLEEEGSDNATSPKPLRRGGREKRQRRPLDALSDEETEREYTHTSWNNEDCNKGCVCTLLVKLFLA
jgi:hypothetical protein